MHHVVLSRAGLSPEAEDKANAKSFVQFCPEVETFRPERQGPQALAGRPFSMTRTVTSHNVSFLSPNSQHPALGTRTGAEKAASFRTSEPTRCPSVMGSPPGARETQICVARAQTMEAQVPAWLRQREPVPRTPTGRGSPPPAPLPLGPLLPQRREPSSGPDNRPPPTGPQSRRVLPVPDPSPSTTPSTPAGFL